MNAPTPEPWPEQVRAVTWHGRSGAVRHAFRYRVEYVLIDPDARGGPRLFGRNRPNLASVHDQDHGGPRGAGRGAAWAWQLLAERGLPDAAGCRLLLLTQPRLFGRVFNPVSFWLAFRGADLVAAVAEVNNTYGDRHCYFSSRPGFAAIGPGDVLTATKVFHVSPFRRIAGSYAFGFAIDPKRVAIRIVHEDGPERLVATLEGARRPLTNGRLLAAALRRPFAGVRTLALIHWQALRLKLKGATFRPRPAPPAEEVT